MPPSPQQPEPLVASVQRCQRPRGVLLVAATELEIERLQHTLTRSEKVRGGDAPLWSGQIDGLPVHATASGIGKANAAMATALALRDCAVDLVVSLGIGGGFAAAGVAVGDLAVATGECYADEGVEADGGCRGLEDIGLPLCVIDGRPYYNALPLHPAYGSLLLASAAQVTTAHGGPFVTVSTVTASRAGAERWERQFHPVCESMEGAAVAHACLLQRVACVEVRGISNPVGPRQREAWQIGRAARVAQDAVMEFLAQLACLPAAITDVEGEGAR